MSLSQPTLEDIWKLFQETDRLIKASSLESAQRFQETERLIKQSREEREKEREKEREQREIEREIEQKSEKTNGRKVNAP